MLDRFKKLLSGAEGRSEFIVAVVCDIRGFSAFSVMRESPDIAMFIKRFYHSLVCEHFNSAAFVKPTGDGLLLVFKYSEKNLIDVASTVLHGCFNALNDFQNMFTNDPMINFDTPSNLGFGVARGTACCLYSNKNIIDYSGQILNLSARLNDLARPRGIVIDGDFQISTIPEELRKNFAQEKAYIRSIAEEKPRIVMRSNDVTLPKYSCSPYVKSKWDVNITEMRVGDLKLMEGNYIISLEHEIASPEKAKLEFFYPHTLTGYRQWREIETYEHYTDAKGDHIRFNVDIPKKIIAGRELHDDKVVTFEFQYIRKKKSRSMNR